MKTIRILLAGLLLFPLSALAQSAGCGAGGTYPAIAAYDQSTCGAVTPFPSAPTSPTSLSATGTLAANTKYQMTADFGSQTAVALTITGPNTVLDLNGHNLAGRIIVNDPNGLHIYSSVTGATHLCNYGVDSNSACIYGEISVAAINAAMEIDHFFIHNTDTNTTDGPRNIFFDYNTVPCGTLPCTSPNILIHHMTTQPGTGTGSTRIANFWIQGNNSYPVFYNNNIVCYTNSAACQGIVAYGTYNTKIYNNLIANQQANPLDSDTDRAAICDQTLGCEIFNNYMDTQDGRAFRFRGTNNTHDVNSAHDNLADNIISGSNGNYIAAVHLGDPDTGTETENLTVYHNLFKIQQGNILMTRGATAINFQDNTVNVFTGTCSSCTMAYLRYSSTASAANVYRTTYTGTFSSSPPNVCETGQTGTICLSGTGSASCTVNNSVCAVVPPVAPARAFFASTVPLVTVSLF